MAKVLNEERFNPSRLPGLSLWLDAQATTTISSTTAGVSSWSDRSEAGNTMNSTSFYVPGCQLWLDASDPNATGTPAANGTAITSWKDKSGLGCNATAGATGTPTIISTGMNGNPTMNFNGSAWFAGSTANTGATTTIFMVMQNPASINPGGPNPNFTRVLSMAPAATNDQDPGGFLTEILNAAHVGFVNGSTSEITYPVNTPYMMDVQANETNIVAYLNGTAYAGSTSTTNFNITRYRVGSMVGNNANVFTGYISEVIVFNTALTTSQRQQIETYLSKKWGIPLSYSIPSVVPTFSPVPSPQPIISNTLITNQPSIFFPPGAQMTSTFNSGLGSPTIPGCQLWLDAADTTTLTPSGSSVTEWKDKSRNGYVFTQNPVTVGAITTSTQNEKTALNFGTNVMTISNFTWYTQFTTLFVVNTNNWFYAGGAGTSTNFYTGYILSGNWNLISTPGAGGTYDPSYGTPGITQVSSVIPNQWCVFSIGYGGGTQAANYAVNGTSRSTNPGLIPTGQSATSTPLYLNGRWDYGGGNTQIGEIIHFNRSITSQERQTVEGYLATKWGLRANLPPTHPYYSVPYPTTSFTLNPFTPVSKSIFMTYQTPALTSTMRFATGDDVSGGAFGLSQTQYYISSPYQYGAGYGDTRWKTNIDQYTLPTVLSAIYDASAGIIRGDRNFNADADVRESAMSNIISNTPYSLGMSSISSSIVTSASFHVCEIIAYNRALATTDRQMIEGYMAWKWGIVGQLPNGHPYKEFPPSGEQVIIPSTPLNLMQGLVSWLDMADTSSYTLSGTTLKTLTDKAGGTLFTISGKPNGFSFSTIGSLPALVFPGNNTSTLLANTFLFRSVPVPSQGSACMVLVPKSQFTASKLGILGWGSPLNSGGNIAVGYNAPTTTVQTVQSYNTSSGTFFGPSLNLTANTPCILFWAWYGGNMVYFSCNGTTLLTGTPGTYYNPASTDTQFYIGNDGGFGAQFTLGELVMYNQYGETPFRNLIEGHLAWKWGLQSNLPAYHPYYYSAPGLQSLTEVNALSQPSDIDGLTMWLDAADTTTLTLTPSFVWIDKSATANHVFSKTTATSPILSTFGTARRPSVYFGPGTSATSTYNSGASTGQFSAFVVASIPTLSYLLISSGQFTTATSAAGANGQTFAFYGSNGSTFGVCSPYVSPGGTKVGPYSTICGATVELFASVSGLTTLGNLNFGSTVSGTCATIQTTPWVFGDCLGDSQPKSFHVHEFITYSRQLTTTERWIIEGYLYWKWMQLI